MSSARPSAWTHSPKKRSFMTHSEARSSRARFLALMAVSLVLINSRPASSTATTTGDNWGRPSALVVARTARGFAAMKMAARPTSTFRLGAEEPGAPPYLILVHDRAGIAVRQAVLVGKPVR